MDAIVWIAIVAALVSLVAYLRCNKQRGIFISKAKQRQNDADTLNQILRRNPPVADTMADRKRRSG